MATTLTGQRESQYLSGQGVLFLAERDVNGNPNGLIPVGNVCDLVLALETTDFDHKECQSGSRTTDLTIVQELTATMTVTFESLERDNLALALLGTASTTAAASATDEQHVSRLNGWLRLDNVSVSAVVVGDDAVPTITYEIGKNYEVDEENGLIFIYSAAEQTARGAVANTADAQTLFFDYTFADQEVVKGFTSSQGGERWMEFAGLNTVDSDNPVSVSVFKAQAQPLSELNLITDEVTTMEVTMNLFQDTLRTTGDQFFTIRQKQGRYTGVNLSTLGT